MEYKNHLFTIKNLIQTKDFKSQYMAQKKVKVIPIKTLSLELQAFVHNQINNGNLIQYKSDNGLAVDKEELEKIISISNNSFNEDTIFQQEEIDVSNNFYFISTKELRERGINTKDFITTKSTINNNKYIDLRQILKPYLTKIAKVLDCKPQEILKQIEPILQKQFIKEKKKEINKK